jgi:hypothetical protein
MKEGKYGGSTWYMCRKTAIKPVKIFLRRRERR